MEAIIDRLRELEAEEVQMLKDHKALLVKRTQEDERRVRERAEEDEAWQSQLLNRDREEDASRVFSCSIQADVLTKNCQTLRQQRRELSRASLTEVLPVASSGKPGPIFMGLIRFWDIDSTYSRLPGCQDRRNLYVRSNQ